MQKLCKTCKISLLCLPVGPEWLAERCFRCTRCENIWLEQYHHEEFLIGHSVGCELFEDHVISSMRHSRGEDIACERCLRTPVGNAR